MPAQGRFRRPAVRRDVRIRDRESGHAPLSRESGEPIEPWIDWERRAARSEDGEAAHRVDRAGVSRQPRRRQTIGKLLVRCEKQLEGSAVLNLSRQRPRRAEDQLDARTGVARELFGDLGQREVQVRGGGDARSRLRGCCFAGRRREQCEQEDADFPRAERVCHVFYSNVEMS